MARAKFLADFDHGDHRVTVAYKAGMELTIPRAHLDAAVAAGAAEEVETPPRASEASEG